MAIDSRAPLDRSPKKNWVEQRGGLPMYIRRIANHLHQEKGMTISHAIPVAINAARKMCASGDTNFPGKQQVNPGSQAEACAAIAQWEKMKGQARVSKGIRGRKMTDLEMVAHIVEKGWVDLSDAEADAIVKELYPDDPDTAEFTTQHEITKVDEDERLVFGWASIGIDKDGGIIEDRQGDILDDPNEIEKAAYDFVLNSRDGGEMHVRKGVSTLVESVVFTPEKTRAMGIPDGTVPTGWWVGFRVNDEEVWKAVKDGKYRMFSVHGRGMRKAMDDD